MNKDRIIICAGCLNKFQSSKTVVYRGKRCCTDQNCFYEIDKKVTNFNYKKQQRKMVKGKYRNGVPIELKAVIYDRDNNTCQNCKIMIEKYRMQVHHIKPVSDGGCDNINNLILLCKTCHSNVHKEGPSKYYEKFRSHTEKLGKVLL